MNGSRILNGSQRARARGPWLAACIAVVQLLVANVAFGEVYRSRNKLHVLEIKGRRFTLADAGELLASGEFKVAPRRALVLESEPAALLVGGNLRLLDRKGRFRWTSALAPVALWLEEGENRVVVVAGKAVHGVDLTSGRAAKLDASVVRAALKRRRDRQVALVAAAETDPRAFEADVAPLLDQRKLPAAQRLLVSLIVARAGGAAVSDEVWDVRSRAGIELNTRYRDAGAAVVWLEDVALDKKKLARSALLALAGMGARGAKALAGLLAHGDVPAAAKRHVLKEASGLPREPFLRALVREFGRAVDDPDNADVVLSALLATGATDIARRVQPHQRVLLQVLEHKTASASWIADYFRTRPTSEAVPGLLKQLDKSRRRGLDNKLIAALKACSGADFGRDKGAWLKNLRDFGR